MRGTSRGASSGRSRLPFPAAHPPCCPPPAAAGPGMRTGRADGAASVGQRPPRGGAWPADWPPPPRNLELHGVELESGGGREMARTALGRRSNRGHGETSAMRRCPQCCYRDSGRAALPGRRRPAPRACPLRRGARSRAACWCCGRRMPARAALPRHPLGGKAGVLVARPDAATAAQIPAGTGMAGFAGGSGLHGGSPSDERGNAVRQRPVRRVTPVAPASPVSDPSIERLAIRTISLFNRRGPVDPPLLSQP